jgi:hypothetical protein
MSRRWTGNLSLCPALVNHLSSGLVLRYCPTLYPFPSWQPFPSANLFLVPAFSRCQHFPGINIALVPVFRFSGYHDRRNSVRSDQITGMANWAVTPLSIYLSDPQGRDEAVARE